MNKPGWIDEGTLVDTINHPCKKVWIEEHQNIFNKEKVYLVCEFGVEPKAYHDLAAAVNAVGEQFGYNDTWKKVSV
jgi:hypothetical protein